MSTLNSMGLTLRAPPTTGVIVVDSTGRPVNFNTEAIAVLTYPRQSRSWQNVRDLLPPEIHSLLLCPQTSRDAPYPTAFTSGRRHYVCRAFALNPSAGIRLERTFVLLIERDTGNTVNISGVAKQSHLTEREQQSVGLLTHRFISKEIASRMNISPDMMNISGVAEQFHLTEREQQSVRLLILGLTSKEIATRMNIRPDTVKTFFRLVMAKMGVSTRAGIVGKIALQAMTRCASQPIPRPGHS